MCTAVVYTPNQNNYVKIIGKLYSRKWASYVWCRTVMDLKSPSPLKGAVKTLGMLSPHQTAPYVYDAPFLVESEQNVNLNITSSFACNT